MKYISIDIETTGLDPQHDQILQIAAVAEDTDRPSIPIDELPHVNFLLAHTRIVGSPFALAMNAEIIKRISKGDGTLPASALAGFVGFLETHSVDGLVTAAGKNFAGFDRPFLIAAYSNIRFHLHHRSIDPGLLYMRSTDTVVPSTDVCFDRLTGGTYIRTPHDALDDAQSVVRLLRGRLFQGVA